MQEKTKEMDGALTNNMEEYRTQKKAREKRLSGKDIIYIESKNQTFIDYLILGYHNEVKMVENSITGQYLSGRKKIPEENAAGYSRYYRNIASKYCAF